VTCGDIGDASVAAECWTPAQLQVSEHTYTQQMAPVKHRGNGLSKKPLKWGPPRPRPGRSTVVVTCGECCTWWCLHTTHHTWSHWSLLHAVNHTWSLLHTMHHTTWSLRVPTPLCPGYAVTAALDLAKKDNVTWLIHLDPDELLHPGASHAAGVLAGSYSLLPELCSTPKHVPSVR